MIPASTTRPFDPAEYLDTDEGIEAYMTDALETGDPAFVADAQDVVARAASLMSLATPIPQKTS
ncbi:DNA-binding protein [Granulicella aggregans]